MSSWRSYVAVLLVIIAAPTLPLTAFLGAGVLTPTAPVAEFTWTPVTPQAGVQFQFTDLSMDADGDIALRAWVFGDGTGITFNTLTHPSHTYATSGTYAVTLTVTDATGQVGLVSHDIFAENVAPVAVITTVESFTLTQNGVTVPIEVSSGTSTAVTYYQYFSASSHMGFETARQSNMVLHRQTSTGDLSLIFTQNIDRDSSGQQTNNGRVEFDLTGVPSGASVALSDDSSLFGGGSPRPEFSLIHEPEGKWEYVDNTDGGVLAGLPTASAWCITVSPLLFFNVNSWVYFSNGVDVNLDQTKPVEICFEPQVDVTSVTVAEGEELVLRGFFDDPAWLDTHSATWDWGDGTVVNATFAPGAGATHHNFDNAGHAYGRAGSYVARVTVVDSFGELGGDTVDVIVTNVVPTVDLTAASPSPAMGGQPVTFDGLFDDPSFLDVHTATWNFGDGTSAGGTFSPGAGASHHVMDAATHTFGAAGFYTVTLTVCDDFSGCASDTFILEVRNTPPVASAGGDVLESEGALVFFLGGFADPDVGDSHTFTWTFGDGTGAPGTATPTHAFADDGVYVVTFTVCDASSACDTDSLNVTVTNVEPTIDLVFPGLSLQEGGQVVFDVGGVHFIDGSGTTTYAPFSFTDPGFDFPSAGTMEDFTATVSWGDSVFGVLAVSELPGSEGVPTTGVLSGASHTFADDGAYTITATVCDDDGGCGASSFEVLVQNVAPTVDAGADQDLVEGGTVSFTATASDPGFDFPLAGTSEDFTATVDWDDGIVESIALVETPGSPGLPSLLDLGTLAHVYGDDGAYLVTIMVCDDDGGCSSDSLLVTVANADPSILGVSVTGTVGARLRVAGEKWHDVTIELFHGGTLVASGGVLRVPGSPDDQSLDLGTFTFDAFRSLTARIVYTPTDDAINGQEWGADPAWVIFTGPAGEVRVHHTFNVRHPDTWVWEPDLLPALAAAGLEFTASAYDKGCDDITLSWFFGDGGAESSIYYNDGIGPDPPKSPFGTFPFTVTDTAIHAYLSAGTYVVTLIVTDDDGGSVSLTIVLALG